MQILINWKLSNFSFHFTQFCKIFTIFYCCLLVYNPCPAQPVSYLHVQSLISTIFIFLLNPQIQCIADMFDGAFVSETTQYIEAFDMNNFNDDDNDVHYSFVHDKNRASSITSTIIPTTTISNIFSTTLNTMNSYVTSLFNLPAPSILLPGSLSLPQLWSATIATIGALAITIILHLVLQLFNNFSFFDVSIINVLWLWAETTI